MPHNITEAKNTSVELSRYLLSKTKVSTPPHPYIGSQGPYKEPLLTNTQSLNKCNITSHK